MTRTPRWLAALALVAGTLLTLADTVSVSAQAPLPPPATDDDAALADVWFADAERGWVVGSRGGVWQTVDGGQSWTRQPVDFTGRLTSIRFGEDQHGWIAGWENVPYTGQAIGVLLRTRDGGQSWIRDRNLLLPPLRVAALFAGGQGWVAGAATTMFPLGVQTTATGGRAWGAPAELAESPADGASPAAPVPSGRLPRESSWVTGDFARPELGLLAAADGSLLRIVRGQATRHRLPPTAGRAPRALRVSAAGRVWLAGGRGLLLESPDLGRSWSPPPAELPPELAGQLDFEGLCVRGEKIWLVGRPGSVVLHSPDSGRHWTTTPTGSPAPLASVFFLDDQRGWAVGSLGVVLGTSDGGQTWKTLRGAGRRAGLLVLALEPRQVPWEILADACGDEQWRGQVELLTHRDASRGQHDGRRTEECLDQAVVALGANGAASSGRFPLPPEGNVAGASRLLAGWDRLYSGAGRQALLAHLVRLLRQWRPDVVSLPRQQRGAVDDPTVLLGQLTQEAVVAAADPQRFAEEHRAVGLEPWQVTRLVRVLGPLERGDLNLSGTQWAARLGCSLSEAALMARGQLETEVAPVNTVVGLRRMLGPRLERGLLAGFVPRDAGGRRELSTASAPAQGLAQAVARQRHVGAILTSLSARPEQSVRLLGQLESWSADLDRTAAGQLWFRLGQEYARHGHWSLAAEVLSTMARKYREHPLTPAALVWLLHYGTSEEVGLRLAKQTGAPSQIDPTALEAAVAGTEPGLLPDVEAAPLEQPGPNSDRAAQARFAAGILAQLVPPVQAEPLARFPLARLDSRENPEAAAEAWRQLASPPLGGCWSVAAAAELWLQGRGGPARPALYELSPTPQKPRLDGRLDDPCWQTASVLPLESASRLEDPWDTEILLTEDGEYLYFAARCHGLENSAITDARGPRRRDLDLVGHDRVELWLDVDRDRATALQLVVDDRGNSGESCWGEQGWNPRWYVAHHRSAEGWILEAAIPLAELHPPPAAVGAVWAVAARRVTPSVGGQALGATAAEEFHLGTAGLLRFSSPQ